MKERKKTMSRYIDADKFEVFHYEKTEGRENTFDEGVQFVLEKIDESPTEDVVPVEELLEKLKATGHDPWVEYNAVLGIKLAEEVVKQFRSKEDNKEELK